MCYGDGEVVTGRADSERLLRIPILNKFCTLESLTNHAQPDIREATE